MKKYNVTQARWANWRDVQLPFYQQWNAQNDLLPRDYSDIWKYPFIALQVPLYSNCAEITPDLSKKRPERENFPIAKTIDAQNVAQIDDNQFDYTICADVISMPLDIISDVLNQILRVTKEKTVLILITQTDDERFNAYHFSNLMRHLNFVTPSAPSDSISSVDNQLAKWGIRSDAARQGERVFGMVIESRDTPMSCGIIIPHWENYEFVAGAIRLARKYESRKLSQHIYLIDDDSKDGSFERLQDDFADAEDISIYQMRRDDKPSANVGKLIDFAIEQVEEKYICSIDADTFPISEHWLTFPLWLLEKYRCAMVGCDTGISNAYVPSTGRRWQNIDGYTPNFCVYDNGYFVGCNNFFRVMKTSLAKVVAQQASFSKVFPDSHQEEGLLDRIKRILLGKKIMDFENYPITIDNGIMAYYFIAVNRLGPEFSIPITSWIGFTPQDGVYGQNVCGLVLHFALSRSLALHPREVADPGDDYRYYAKNIISDGLSDELLQEMLAECVLRPGGYDGSIPVEWYQKAQASFDGEFELYLKALDNYS